MSPRPGSLYDVRSYADVVQNKKSQVYTVVQDALTKLDSLKPRAPYWKCARQHNYEKVSLVLTMATWTLHVTRTLTRTLTRTSIPRSVTQVAWTNFYYTLKHKLVYFLQHKDQIVTLRCHCTSQNACARTVQPNWDGLLRRFFFKFAAPAPAHVAVFMHLHLCLGNDLARTIFSYL